MNKVKIIVIIIYVINSIALGQSLKIYGDAKPGSILIGNAEKIKSVTLDKQKLLFDENGYFVFGFDRDAKGTHTLKVKYTNKKNETKKFVLPKRKYEIQRLKMAKKYVNPPDEEMERINEEAAEMKIARSKVRLIDTAFYSAGFVLPVENPNYTGVFGSQRILNGVKKSPHNGVDFGAEEGTPVYAMSDGIVIIAGDNFYYNGNFVLLSHGQGLTSVYLHLSKLEVSSGDKVFKGQKIGEVGTTGRSTAAHLHFGVQWYKKRIDPMSLLNMKFENSVDIKE